MIMIDDNDPRNPLIAQGLGIPLIKEGEINEEVILLPVRGCDNDLSIRNTLYDLKSIYFKHPFRKVITGKVPQTLFDFSLNRFEIYSYYDNEFVSMNSKYTAEGLCSLIIQKTPISLFNKRVLILGYGASGKEIARLLSYFTQNIDVYNRTFYEMDYRYLNDIPNDEYDIVINTLPVFLKNAKGRFAFDISSSNVYPNSIFEPIIPSRLMMEDASGLIVDKIKRFKNE